jgi:type VI secretion system protein ImpG
LDPRLLKYYNRELQHVREMGAEFAREYPKIAARLGMDGIDCADPYVERLLEGFAYLTARVQLKIDAEFPNFIQNLLQIVYPHYLAPTPSMTVVQLQPDSKEPALAQGYSIPRGAMLRANPGRDDSAPCEYRTAHECTLWPLRLNEVRYYGSAAALAAVGATGSTATRAGLRLSFTTTAGVPLSALHLDRLPIYLSGADELPFLLYESIFASATGFLVRPKGNAAQSVWRRATCIEREGFGDEQGLIPYTRRSFQGYRILQEYCAFPERFLFFTLSSLREVLRTLAGNEFEIILLFNRAAPGLEGTLAAENFRLFCTPAINLTRRRADRIHLDRLHHEYQVIADRTRPLDFEIFDVQQVEGYGSGSEAEITFEPFYASTEATWHGRNRAFFMTRREPRMLSTRQRVQGPRSSYIGSELFLSLVDADQAPYANNLRQLALEVLCTNRDLPLQMPVGKGATDFTLDLGAPVESIRCLSGPTRPRASAAHGEFAWKLLSHLTLNYLSLVEKSAEEGATALRELLLLYCDPNDAAMQRQIDGVRRISARAVSGRLPDASHVSYVRGLEIALTCEDGAFQGRGVFLLGAVLEEFFRRYVSLNSFTRTVLKTQDRGEVMRWPARLGQRQIL